jgi:hypothetical protein
MRHLTVLLASVTLAACSTAPATPGGSATASPTHVAGTVPRQTAIDPVVQFLMTAAANDFYTHRPPDPVRFRDVRLGHVLTASGEAQYLLCGQFLPKQESGKPEWMPFATIKTSGYEQWLGGQAAEFCRRPAVVWDGERDLSGELQSRLDSVRSASGGTS